MPRPYTHPNPVASLLRLKAIWRFMVAYQKKYKMRPARRDILKDKKLVSSPTALIKCFVKMVEYNMVQYHKGISRGVIPLPKKDWRLK